MRPFQKLNKANWSRGGEKCPTCFQNRAIIGDRDRKGRCSRIRCEASLLEAMRKIVSTSDCLHAFFPLQLYKQSAKTAISAASSLPDLLTKSAYCEAVCLALWFPSSFQSAENFLATKKKSMTVCHGCVLRTVNITPYFYNDYPGNFIVFLAAPTVLSSKDLVWNFSWSFFSSIFFLNQRRKHSPPRFFFLNTMIRILQRWVGIIK